MKIEKKHLYVVILLAAAFLIVYGARSKGSEYIVSPENDKRQSIEAENEMGIEPAEDYSGTVKVFVSGEVANYGVVEVPYGARLIDAVEKLGGLTTDADINRTNLAQKLEDGNHYVILKIGEEALNAGANHSMSNSGGGGPQSADGKININAADKTALMELPGIGPVTAERIIAYREQGQGFKSVEDIMNVSGIGQKKYDGIKDMITVK